MKACRSLLLVIAGVCAAAAQPPREARLRGPTDVRMLQTLRTEIGRGTRVFRIDSRGGREADALLIAHEIERAGAALIVDGACLSACSQYLLPAARSVVVSPGALVSFHLNSFGILHMPGVDAAALANERELRANAQAAKALYDRRKIDARMLVDITSAMRPTCVLYAQASSRLFAEVDAWVPTRRELAAYGLKISGFWPSTPADYRALSLKYYGPRGRIFFGPLGAVRRVPQPALTACGSSTAA